MPKIPAKSKSRAELEKEKIRAEYSKKQARAAAKAESPVGWGHVLLVFVVFSIIASIGWSQKLPWLYWTAIGLGNTILFFLILFIVIRKATQR